MLHGLAMASLVLSACVFAATVYVLSFALYGISLRHKVEFQPDPPMLPRFLVLLPAHNESAGLRDSIFSVLGADYPNELLNVVVIADNCTDDTAEIARSCGADVWVRNNCDQLGKGFALAWALAQVDPAEFDLVAIIDADTVVDQEFFVRMARASSRDFAAGKAAAYQGAYSFASMKSKPQWFDTLSVASKAAENSFTYRPRSEAGLVTLIQGNGFCLSILALEVVPFHGSSITEDAEYALELALADVPVRFVEGAKVFARMTDTVQAATSQRLRWASGIFQLTFVSAPKLIGRGIARGSWKLVEAAVMLLFTSRVLLAALTVFALAFALALPHGAATYSLALVVASISLQMVYLLLIFRKAADKPFPTLMLFTTPFYLAFVAVTQAFALSGLHRKRWSRTVR